VHRHLMQIAIDEAMRGVASGEGGPFGAVVARGGEVIATGHNQVLLLNDPSAHAEMQAVRAASAKLGRFDLSDCELYSSCEPCPMCLSAAIWAKIPRLYYGCTRVDAEQAGFDDKYIYDHICGVAAESKLDAIPFMHEECLTPFAMWAEKKDRRQY
jgi:guanine deaminase